MKSDSSKNKNNKKEKREGDDKNAYTIYIDKGLLYGAICSI